MPTLTFLGHAGLAVETGEFRLLADPWFAETGAFLGSWHQFPRNDHLAIGICAQAGDTTVGEARDALTRWTEEYQENVYEHQVKMLKRIPFLRGACPWILMDFRSPRRPLPGIQEIRTVGGIH